MRNKTARTIDARGLPCPQPVINTKNALEAIEKGTVTVLVDSAESRENVRRFAQSQGYRVEVTEQGAASRLAITKQTPGQAGDKRKGAVIFITGDRLGTGDEKFGESLMNGLINNLAEVTTRPEKVIFVNSGVRLTTGSGVLETLKKLEGEGVQIWSCGACLEYYHLTERLKVGAVTNMYEVVDSLLTADKVIKL